jgi:hypothetical protein
LAVGRPLAARVGSYPRNLGKVGGYELKQETTLIGRILQSALLKIFNKIVNLAIYQKILVNL